MTRLSDAALQDFIIRGYRVVQPTATADLHGELHRQVECVLAAGNPGNELIDRIPLLHQLFADPVVDAALTGILGPGYALCRHCHCLRSRAGQSSPRIGTRIIPSAAMCATTARAMSCCCTIRTR